MDFTIEDADCRSDWCRQARKPGGGGGRGAGGDGGAAAPSLSNLMAQQLAAAQGVTPVQQQREVCPYFNKAPPVSEEKPMLALTNGAKQTKKSN